jgi:hypothetical protein
MINAQRQRIEQEMTGLVDNLDRSYLRKMQVSSSSRLMALTILNLFHDFRHKCIIVLQSAALTKVHRWNQFNAAWKTVLLLSTRLKDMFRASLKG